VKVKGGNPAAALIVALGLVVSGCAIYDSPKTTINKGWVKQKFILEEDNFRVVKAHVQGEASCPHILVINYPSYMIQDWGFPVLTGIALGNPDIYERAMADLHSKHDLMGKAQQFHNIVEEWDITNYLGFYADFTLTISAEVIEFIDTKDDIDHEKRTDA
jgi:hypothetical protein